MFGTAENGKFVAEVKNERMGNTALRCFVAVSLPDRVKQHLGKLQKGLKRQGLVAGWPAPDRFHITLAFIGDVLPERLERITRTLDHTASVCRGFDIFTFGMGVFPGVNRARVLWAGVHGDTRALADVHMTLCDGLGRAGILLSPQKFTPHITLARLKRAHRSSVVQRILRQPSGADRGPDFHVGDIRLYRSRLYPDGVTHEKLYRAGLL